MTKRKLLAVFFALMLMFGGLTLSAHATEDMNEDMAKEEAYSEDMHNDEMPAAEHNAENNEGLKKAPDFTAQAADGIEVSLSDYLGQVVVLEWINYECPYVKKHYESGNMQGLQEKYASDVVWLTINSSAEGKQGHYDAEKINELNAEHNNMSMHYLMDSTGEIGQAYDAKTTPHMFVINEDGYIIYEGAIDSIPSADKGDIEKAENYVVAALEAHMAGEDIKTPKTQPYGCSVKY